MVKRLATLSLVLLVCSGLSAAPLGVSKSMERPTGDFDRAAHIQNMLELRQRLSDAAVSLPEAAALQITVTPEERQSVIEGSLQDEAMMQKMRVGLVKDLTVPMEFASERPGRVRPHDIFGAVRGRDDGGLTWSGVVRAPSAAALRVHFVDFNLPEGAELYVHAANGMAFGPYTGRGPNGTGDFWSNTIAGAEMTVQLDAPEGVQASFTIAGVGYMTERFGIASTLAPEPVTNAANTKPCSFNADCTVDAACGTEDAAVTTARNAVAHMLFASGAYLYICSGGLVADSVTTSNIPYFITANHCIGRSSEASSLETFFFYTSPTCQSCPDPGAANTTGSTIVSSNRSSDYTLLRLSQNAPAGATFLGWTSTAVANSNGAPLFRLSHPKGSPQAYSAHVVDTAKGTCQSWPRGPWIYSRDILGATEGGSSGSPVVNALGQLVGQLSGGCGFNVNDVCDTVSNATVDGAFAAYYSKVSAYLGSGSGGGGGCTDADGDGVCASAGDCNDNNAKIYPGANDTTGKQGRDGVDNDCDGVIDG
jgi:Trypsin-like peptidase domain/Putative metal-binding motif